MSTHVRCLASVLALAGGCYTGVGTHASGGGDAADEASGGDAADDDDDGDGTAGDDGPGALA